MPESTSSETLLAATVKNWSGNILSLSQTPISREIIDDITVHVIFFTDELESPPRTTEERQVTLDRAVEAGHQQIALRTEQEDEPQVLSTIARLIQDFERLHESVSKVGDRVGDRIKRR